MEDFLDTIDNKKPLIIEEAESTTSEVD